MRCWATVNSMFLSCFTHKYQTIKKQRKLWVNPTEPYLYQQNYFVFPIQHLQEMDVFDISLDDDEKYFHSIIGHIEDILMEQTFLDMHVRFMEKHWEKFEDSEENKLIYTEIFNEYIATMEKYMEKELHKRVANFNMLDFEADLGARSNDLEGEIFEVLATFSDFCAFKNMFLDYKNMKEGKIADFSSDLSVSHCRKYAEELTVDKLNN